MKGLSIRPAERGDVALLLSLIKELAEFEKLAHEVVADEEVLSASLFGEESTAEAVLAEVDGMPVAFALFFHNFSTFLGRPGLYLEDLYVRSSHRGQGIGRRLLAHLAKIACERGCGRMEWWVLDWNRDAIKFYEGLGARPMRDWTVYRLTGQELRTLGGV